MYYSTKILHNYQQQANLFVSITILTDLPDMLLPMWLSNQIYKWFIIFQWNFLIKIAISHFVQQNIHHNGMGICSKYIYPQCVYYLVELAKSPICNQLSPSGCKLNPSTNAYFIAFIIGEHAVLENWFIHIHIYINTN